MIRTINFIFIDFDDMATVKPKRTTTRKVALSIFFVNANVWDWVSRVATVVGLKGVRKPLNRG